MQGRRVHTTGAGDGDINELADMFDILQVAVVRHVLWRMSPVPGVVGAVVAVEEGVAGILEDLDGLLGLGHVAAELLKLLVRHRALAPALGAGADGVTQRDGEIIAGLSVDLLDDLGGKAQTVFKAAAVLVGTEVHVRDGELVEVVALVDGVDLNAVDAGLAQLLGGGAEVPDHLLDLLNGEGTGVEVVGPAVGRGGGGGAGVLHVDDGACQLVQQIIAAQSCHPGRDRHGAAEAAGQLDKELAAGLVVLVHVGLEHTVHLTVGVQPLAAHGVADDLHAGQDQADAVLGALEQEVRSLLVKVRRLQPTEQGRAAHGTLYDAIRDLYLSDFKRSKQSFILWIHSLTPFSFVF